MRTITHFKNQLYVLLVAVFSIFSISPVKAQNISGPSPIDQGTTWTYNLNTQGQSLSNVQWNVGAGGQLVSSNPSGAQVKAVTGANFNVSASYQGGNGFTSFFITVNPTGPTAPATPPTPTVQKFCDYTRLTRANPPSGVTYYWQSSSSGTSTGNSNSFIDRTSGTVYYLRARGNSSGLWSSARSVSYTIDYAPSAPLSPTLTNNCGNTVLTRANPNPTSNVIWYWQSSATGTSTANSAISVTRTSGTVYYLRAKTNGVNCWGPARTVNYTINTLPSIPTTPTVSANNCGSTVLARSNPPTGITWYWQSSSNGTSTSNSSATITRTSGTIYYLRARNNSTLCWSSGSASVSYSIDSPPPTPTAPTVSANNCDNTVLARSTSPTGVTWYWQSSATGTSTGNSNSTITLTNGTVYYLRAKSNSSNCWSASSASINYTITYSPSAPLSPTVTNNCGNTVLTRDDPNPTSNVTWYWQSSASGTSTANSQPTVTLTNGTVYYLRAKTNGANCWGPARTINYTVDNGPSTPTTPTISANNCGSTVLARSNPPSGITWYWQNSANGTSTSNSNATITLTSGTAYYLRARNNSSQCWGSNSASVSYSLDTPPATPTAPTVSANNCDNTVLARSNPPSGVTWYWQDSPTSTSTANSSSTVTRTNGTVYYLRAKSNSSNCWSASSASVSYNITYSPSAPLTPTVTNDCGSTILTRDDPNPTSNVTWYWQSSATGTSTANSQPTVTLTSGTVYYLRAKTNGANCWGPATAVNYTVDSGPSTPASPTISATNCGSTVLARSNPPSGITWYWQSSAAGISTSNSSATITRTDGTIYYLRARSNNSDCWSENSSSVSYTIDTAPPTPTAPTVSANNCDNTVLARSNPQSGITWYWQDSPTGTSTANSDATVTRTNGTIYYLRAKSNNSDCWSDDAASVSYTINYGPSAPLTPTSTNNCGYTILTRDDPNPTSNVTWYWQGTADGTSTANSQPTVSLTSGTAYYLRAKTNGANCWGPAREVNYTVNLVPLAAAGANAARCGSGTVTLTASPGANGNTIRWWSSATGGTLLATSLDYATPSISATTTYYAESYNTDTDCFASTRHPIQAQVTSGITWYLDADGDGFAAGTLETCDDPGPDYTQTVLPETDCNDNNPAINPNTIWYADADNDGLGDPNSPSTPSCTPPSGYVSNNNDQCPSITSATNDCGVTNNDPSDQNYIYTRAYQAKTTSATNFFTSNDSLIQNITYFDGLGRAIQQIGIDQTPDKKDIVTFMDYDDYGRVVSEYLPYPETDSDLGTYRLSAQANTLGYYNTAKYQNTDNPYSEAAFEVSPLNRVLKQAAPGEEWKMGNDHEIEFDYLTNTSADNVKLYRVTLSFSNNTYIPTLTLNGDYLVGTLYKNIVKDENHSGSTKNHTTEEFKDKQGRVVLKRTYADAAGQSQARHDTYYVYDDFGNLSYVLPPKMEASSTSISEINSKMDDLGYRYVYDHRNRLVVKQIPGKEEEYIVYNKLDQPVMSQDANLRAVNQWVYTKYDAFGRVAYTGIATNAETREQAQAYVNNLTGPLWVSRTALEQTIGGTPLHYNNDGYPKNTITDVHTINYYDDYTFDRAGAEISISSFGLDSETNVHGLATGSKVKVLGTDSWITTVSYYDDKGRPIYSYSKNDYLQTTDIIEMKLDFVGRTTRSRTQHIKDNITITTLDNFTYDHVGRLLSQTQCIGDENMQYTCEGSNGGGAVADLELSSPVNATTNEVAINSITLKPGFQVVAGGGLNFTAKIDPDASGVGSVFEELIAFNNYDELGRLEFKKLGGTPAANLENSPGIQTVDYQYNVREWLTDINQVSNPGDDFFTFHLGYTETANPLYNGNISTTQWQTPASNEGIKSYQYTYDALNRIKAGISNNGNYDLSLVTYDKNGNIEQLQRRGAMDEEATSFGPMDALTYTIDQGNKLLAVADEVNNDQGFKDSNTTGDDYSYDDNGNMIEDKNKDITNIEYNYLNLPTKIQFATANNTIEYTYDGTGTKLRKTVTEEGTISATDYAGNHIYENDTLQFFFHPEGYVEARGNLSSPWEYQYYLKDHLGNIRVVFSSDPETLEFKATMESEAAVDEEAMFTNVAETRTPSGAAAHSPNEAARLTTQQPVGPAISLAVSAGDTLHLEAYGYYEGGSGYSNTMPISNFIGAVAGAFGGVAGGAPDQQAVYDIFESALTGLGLLGSEDDGVPAAYLNYLLFDQNMVYQSAGFKQTTSAANLSQERVFIDDIVIDAPGVIYCYVSYESNSTNPVYWDDFSVTLAEHPVQESKDYYPFGLTQKGPNIIESNSNHKYGFGGKEEQNELGLGLIDFTFRNFDPTLGSWRNLDPLAEGMRKYSPYSYAFDNPIYFIDPDGLMPQASGGCGCDSIATEQLDEVVVYGEDKSGSMTRGIADVGDSEISGELLTTSPFSRRIPEGAPMLSAYDPSKAGKGPLLNEWARSDDLLWSITYSIANDAFQVIQTFDFDLIPGETNPLTGRRANINIDGSPNYKPIEGFVNTATLAVPLARGAKPVQSALPKGLGYLNKLNASQFSQLFKGNLAKLSPQWRGYLNRFLNFGIGSYNTNIPGGTILFKTEKLKSDSNDPIDKTPN